MMKIHKTVTDAMQRYYSNRRGYNIYNIIWDKDVDLDFLSKACRKQKTFVRLEACAGTFWLYWRTGKTVIYITEHEEDNYLEGKVCGKRVLKQGEWVDAGTKILA